MHLHELLYFAIIFCPELKTKYFNLHVHKIQFNEYLYFSLSIFQEDPYRAAMQDDRVSSRPFFQSGDESTEYGYFHLLQGYGSKALLVI